MPKALYTFRFDLNGNAREEVVFKFRFGEPEHRQGDDHSHCQSFRVLTATVANIGGDAGEQIVAGVTGEVARSAGVSAFAGKVPELWASDAFAFQTARANLFSEDCFDPDVFLHKENLFKNRNVMAMVLEVPNTMIGQGKVHAWASISLYGHAPEIQVCRWGFPLITHLFLSNPTTPTLTSKYHSTVPS